MRDKGSDPPGSRHAASLSTVTSLSRTLNGSRLREAKKDTSSSFADLCEFARTLKKPRWLVRFPLVLPSPIMTPSTHKCRPLSHTSSIRHSSSSQPKTHLCIAALAASQPVTTRHADTRSKSQEVLGKLEKNCEELRKRERKVVRRQKKRLISIRRQLETCGKHASLISYSNSRAPYFQLLQKFSAKNHIYE